MTGTPFTPAVSVVVLNHKRPHLIGRVLQGIAQLDYPAFEVVIVSDQPDLATRDVPGNIRAGVRHVHFAESNICRARNLALQETAGEIIAFCDDDAVPEPDWLHELIRPFRAERVGAVGGLIRAEDGIAIEWQGQLFDRAARHCDLDFLGDEMVFLPSVQVQTGKFAALRGVNSAFRRAALGEIGGFDESYRYFLDETDAALRMAEAGWATALTRSAEVHHLREQNAVRGGLNKPRNLFEVAASKAYFCKRHLPAVEREAVLESFRTERLADLDSFLRMGAMRGTERDELGQQIETGIADGLTRTPQMSTLPAANRTIAPQDQTQAPVFNIAMVCGWGFRRSRRMRELAQLLSDGGHRVSVFAYQSGRRIRSVHYSGGVWVHRGGTWRLDHVEDGKRLIWRNERNDAELRRVFDRRQFNVWIGPESARPDGAFAPLKIAGLDRSLAVVAMDEITGEVSQMVAEIDRVLATAQTQPSAEIAVEMTPSGRGSDENAPLLMKYKNGQQNA